jgi:hypothetical protein
MLPVGRGSATVEGILRDVGAHDGGVPQARSLRAALGHRCDAMRAALAEGARIDAANEPLGSTALGRAAAIGDEEAVRALLDAGAAVDRPGEDGLTPLWHAAGVEQWQYHDGHLAVVKMLLAAGADVKRRPEGVWPVLARAMDEGLEEVEQALTGAGADVAEAAAAVGAQRSERERLRAVAGLHHLAVLYPTRAELADAPRQPVEAVLPLEGASDHGVSEALYLRDPDGNGVELYWDRPVEQWPRDREGGLEMYSRSLDLHALLREAPARR